mgnify:CR=1 FL=1
MLYLMSTTVKDAKIMNNSVRKTNYIIASFLFYISAIVLTVMIGVHFYQYITLLVIILVSETIIHLISVGILKYLYREQ